MAICVFVERYAPLWQPPRKFFAAGARAADERGPRLTPATSDGSGTGTVVQSSIGIFIYTYGLPSAASPGYLVRC